MPNRLVRQGILDSDRVNKLSWPAEVFYRRLMSVVDDFGLYDGRVSMLRSQCYPIKLDKVSETDIDKWTSECSEAGLVSRYEVEGRPYIEILDFNQRLRKFKSKFPPNPANGERVQPVDSEPPLETNQNTKQNLNQNAKSQNLIDHFFREFPNSPDLERIAMVLKRDDETGQQAKARLLKAFPLFKQAASLEYKNFAAFADHFKNWFRKHGETAAAPKNIKHKRAGD